MTASTPAPAQQFHVEGMSCQHCVRSVQDAVWATDPEADVQVDLPAGRVDIASAAPRAQLAAAIASAGYRVQP
ncbi:MAG: heavy-metal-associated domain-containing protein [Xenophilus sp.]